jgi:hypothetical protein
LVDGIGEGLPLPEVVEVGQKKLRRCVMIREVAVEEVVGAAALLCFRQEKKESLVHLPPGVFPPSLIKKAFKWTCYESTTYGNVRMLAFPHKRDGHWVILVRFEQPFVLNPVLPQKEGREILRNSKK